MQILLYLLAGYLLLVGIVFLVQRKLLYFPDPTPPAVDTVRLANGMIFEPWPDRGPAFRGYVGANLPKGAPVRGTVIVFHGNAGSARDRFYYGLALEARNYRVLLAEYPAYGGRGGELGENAFIRDGQETARLALATFGDPLLIWGESLGAAVAAGVAADPALPVAGVALITPWDSLPDLAQTLYWYLPARWLLRDRYDNLAALNRYGGKVAVLVAERDEIIPAPRSQRLYDELREPKRRWVFADAGHNSWPVDPRSLWWDEVLQWLESGDGAGTAPKS